MKVKRKTLYISNDGFEFDTKEACLRWESRKHEMNVDALTDEQIVEICGELFHYTDGEDVDTSVKIEIRDGSLGDDIDVRINAYQPKHKETHYCSFILAGHGKFFTVYPGDDEHLNACGIDVADIYRLLESFGFFNEYVVQPISNKNITAEWVTIFQQDIPANAYPINSRRKSQKSTL